MENENPIEPSVSPVVEEKKGMLSLFKQKKILIAAAGLLLATIVIVILLMMLGRSGSNQPPATSTSQAEPEQVPAPVFTSSRYDDRSQLGSAKSTTLGTTAVKVYPLKSSLSDSDITALKTKLRLNNTKFSQSSDAVELHSFEAGEKSEYLLVDKRTGTFDFYTYKGLKSSASSSPQQIALDTLDYLGMKDATVSCPITYQRTTMEGIIYVECHRYWNELGAPLLNLTGILNMPESKFMATLSPGVADATGPKDSSVVNTSNNQNGLSRPTDFNTVVVGIDKNGSVTSINSTMKPLDYSKTTSTTQIITPKDALAKIRDNKADISITVPAGVGSAEWEKVYPNSQANGTEAIITDMMLSYIEMPVDGNQTKYEPYYVAKGVATLTSGYTVKFVQAVKAGKTTTGMLDSANSVIKNLIPKAYAQTDVKTTITAAPSVTAVPSVTAAPTSRPSPTINPVCISPTPGESPDCLNNKNQFTKIKVFDIPGYGKLTVGITGGGNNTYYLINTTGSGDKQELIYALAKGLCPDLKIPDEFAGCKARFPKVFVSTNGDQFANQFDPKCYISGQSPAVFLYPTKETHLSLYFGSKITYSDPAIIGNLIQLQVTPDGTITTDGVSRSYLYYEYNNSTTKFSQPSAGLIANDSNFEYAIAEIAYKLGLNESETQRLIQDAINAKPLSAYYQISIADEKEVATNLPLGFSVQPDSLARIHLLIKPLEKIVPVDALKIQPIQRNGFTVIELGATTTR